MITERTVWMTPDGRGFDKKADAFWHDEVLNLAADLEKHCFELDNDAAVQVAAYLKKNYKIEKLL